MGLFAVSRESSLFEVSNYGIHPARSEVDTHDLVKLGLDARFGEVLDIDGSLHFGVHG